MCHAWSTSPIQPVNVFLWFLSGLHVAENMGSLEALTQVSLKIRSTIYLAQPREQQTNR